MFCDLRGTAQRLWRPFLRTRHRQRQRLLGQACITVTLSAPLTEPPFQIVALTDQDRSTFSCGAVPLDDYLRRQANQDVKRHVAACFVAIHASTGRLAGYYTLSACHLYLNDLPPEWQRKLPKYPTVPAVRLGRLAIDLGFQGRNLGAALLANAAKRAYALTR